MSLRNLPFELDDIDEDISKVYIRERDLITSTNSLILFVQQWRPLFKIVKWDKTRLVGRYNGTYDSWKPLVEARYKRTYDAWKQLVEGTFNPEETLACVIKLRNKEDCAHIGKYSCCGLHIMMPYPLLDAFQVARKFQVPINVALIQLAGGYKVF